MRETGCMRNRWPILALLCVLTSLLAGGTASASSPSGAENRVWAFDLAEQVHVAGELALTPELHQGCELAYDDSASRSLLAAKGGGTVIGKLDDIGAGKLRSGENSLLKHLDGDLGSPRANWGRNSSVLRTEMGKGVPIRDATVNPNTGALINDTGFLRAERNLLRNQGWTYNPGTTLWSPPR